MLAGRIAIASPTFAADLFAVDIGPGGQSASLSFHNAEDVLKQPGTQFAWFGA